MKSPRAPVRLRTEFLQNPMGIEEARPRLSWEVSDPQRGAMQRAYRVQAATSARALARGKADLWDSGCARSDVSVGVRYAGPPLVSGQTCWWRVQTWNKAAAPSPWSRPATWEMGLLNRSDWQAQWIASALVGGARVGAPCPYLRRVFTLRGAVRRARLYATALGLYECEMNGRRVGADQLAPGWTDYGKRVRYQVYDVAPLLREGDNVLGALLADGWYCGHVEWRDRQFYGDRPRFLAQLVVDFADGTRDVITTDRHWNWLQSPLLAADLVMGEMYDARLDVAGWSEPGLDDSRWQPVELMADPGMALVSGPGPAVRAVEELRPVAICRESRQSWNKSQWIFDLGQNMVGRVRLKVNGPAGTTVVLRHAEMLDEKGELYTANLRTARATDTYTLKGGGEEVWEPRFTFHGFRYVELRGWLEDVGLDTVTGVVLHSDMEPTGTFECSDPLINQLQHNIQWGQRGNFVDVPTDCPQRDERLGWTGDAQVFVRTAAYNFDVAGFFAKWQQDIADAQRPAGFIPPVVPSTNLGSDPNLDGGPAWADAMIICPWTIYRCYGDLELLARHYDAIRRFVDSLAVKSLNHIRVHPKIDSWGGFGDWLAMDNGGQTSGLTSKDLIGTAFYAYSAGLMADIAERLGRRDDARRYAALREKVRAAFCRRFVTPGGLVAGQTQTAYVLALHFDLLPERLRPAAAEELVRDIERRGGHLSTGFVGTPYLLHVLTKINRMDVAYRLLHQKTFPGWLYPVLQGATTIWERWDGWTKDKGFQDPGMNSFNHYAYGSVGSWLYQVVAGIELDPEVPGYKRMVIQPRPGGELTRAAASLRTVHGMVKSAWRLTAGRLDVDVTLPANTTATIILPAEEAVCVQEGGRPAAKAAGLKLLGCAGGNVHLEAGAGRYRFTMPRS